MRFSLMVALCVFGSATPAPLPAFTDVAAVAPSVRIDMRYASADNFLKEAAYPSCARCVLRTEAAEALARVQTSLQKQGFSLLLWDCYRPPAVQEAMWKILPDARYVADPKRGSVHNRGGAVDLSLAGPDGVPLEMPTAHDDFTEKAAADAPASEAATKNRATLRAAMEAEGFSVWASEWWHYNYRGSAAWPIVEQPLCEKR